MDTSHRVGCPALRDIGEGCCCSEPPISESAATLSQQIAQVRRDLLRDPESISPESLRKMLLRSLEGMEILSRCVDQLGTTLRAIMNRHGRS